MYQNVILTTAINNETRHYTAKCWSTMENQFKYLFGAHDTPMYPSVECSPNVDYGFKPYIRIRCYSVHDFIIIDHCYTNGLRVDLLYFTCSKKIKMTWPYLLHGPYYTCNEEREPNKHIDSKPVLRLLMLSDFPHTASHCLAVT
ncbi:hypothetical protein K501DRAFT_267880 [Backusella circina FSU 941]|nr:hypothetical protein K501DRAFT_267880 [Backusella circina FSU 941]